MAPGLYHVSKLLDQLQGMTQVTTILFYPGSIEGTTGLRFMDLKDREALGNYRVQVYDRFRYRVDLAPSDIREVATKRVLAKKPEADPILQKLFGDNQGTLNAALRLERMSRRTTLSESDFVQFYPYPPHYIDLCIGMMSGIRLQPGAPRQCGGSNRAIIKQAYEMLVSDRTAMVQKPIGTLVTLDKERPARTP
jgi:hypothetical protein